ncbi:uncharacterized protein [Cebidichthys violaceus]|uniref:uncharacterized protein isoform X4 n=1 Tax=Cebidichthys violaceus TaxID=271503 RepID=UPI0035CC8CB2
MEMWLKRSTLVLLTAALVISDQALVILDEKRSTEAVKVPHGSSVTFQCRLKTGAHDTFRVIWYLNPSTFDLHNLSVEFFNKSAKKSRVVSNKTKQDSKEDTEETWPTYTLSNATDQDSGWYFCKVIIDIPVLIQINSSGTEVVITKSEEHTTDPATVSPTENFTHVDRWMWIMLGVSSVILIVLLVVCVLLTRRHRRSREDPIYANTRPVASKQPSPRPGTDHLKAGSSSQNPRNPSPGRRYDEGKQRYR